MSEHKVIERLCEVFREIAALGERQVATYRSLNSSRDPVLRSVPFGEMGYERELGLFVPKRIKDTRLLVRPDVHQYLLLDAFWSAYVAVTDNIASPTVAFAIRPLLELSLGRVIYFGRLPEERQRKIALEYHLLSLANSVAASVGGRYEVDFRADYDTLLPNLPEKDRPDYELLRDSGFPLWEVSRRLDTRVYPTVRDEDVIARTKDDWVSLFGKPIPETVLRSVFHYFSGYVHPWLPNMRNLRKLIVNKKHLRSTSALLFMFGLDVVEFANSLTQNAVSPEKVSAIRESVRELYPSLLPFSSQPERSTARPSSATGTR